MIFFQISGAVHEQAGSSQFGRHIRKLKCDGLLLADRTSELFSFFGVFQSIFICTLRNAEGLCSDADPSSVQSLHGDLEALARIPILS